MPAQPIQEKPKSGAHPAAMIVLVVFIIVAIAGSIAVYSISGWGVPAQAKSLKNPFPTTPEGLTSAKIDYSQHCVSCHGATGDGRGERAEKLSIAPADLRDAHAMGLRTDGELYWIITQGHKPMPAFRGTMSDEQRWHLVDYVRAFAQK